MAFSEEVEHVLFQQTKVFLPFFFEDGIDLLTLVFFYLFIQVEKRDLQLFAEQFAPVGFAASHKTDEKDFHIQVMGIASLFKCI